MSIKDGGWSYFFETWVFLFLSSFHSVAKDRELELKCEFSYTFVSLFILNKFWSTFIQTKEKYIEAHEEWCEEEHWWTMHNIYDAK